MKTNDEFCAQKNGYSVTKELSELTAIKESVDSNFNI